MSCMRALSNYCARTLEIVVCADSACLPCISGELVSQSGLSDHQSPIWVPLRANENCNKTERRWTTNLRLQLIWHTEERDSYMRGHPQDAVITLICQKTSTSAKHS
jgi:hypothetical protein